MPFLEFFPVYCADFSSLIGLILSFRSGDPILLDVMIRLVLDFMIRLIKVVYVAT